MKQINAMFLHKEKQRLFSVLKQQEILGGVFGIERLITTPSYSLYVYADSSEVKYICCRVQIALQKHFAGDEWGK